MSSAWTRPRAPRCMPRCCSHSPQSETPMSPIPIASVTRAPQPSSSWARKAGSPPPGSPATMTRLDAGGGEVDATVGGPLDQVCGVGGRQRRGLRAEQFNRLHQPLGVARADWNLAEADAVERAEGRPGHERPGVVAAHEALARGDARGGVAARRAGDPVREVVVGQGDVARRAGGPAGRVDADDLVAGRAEVGADRVVGGDRLAQLLLGGQGQRADLGEPSGRLGIAEPRRGKLGAVERRALEQVRELSAVAAVVDRELLRPRPGLDLGLEHQPSGVPGGS